MATRRVLRMSSSSSPPPSAQQQQRRVVVLGGGIQGASAAYHLGKAGAKVTLVELESVGSAASGKAGGFLAKDWGSGPTHKLHTESFRMHQELARELGLETFREIETLSVASGKPSGEARRMRSWLDGDVAEASLLDTVPNTAQVTPLEITSALADAAVDRYGAQIVYGRALGIQSAGATSSPSAAAVVSGVRVQMAAGEEVKVLPCDDLLVAMGVWSTLCAPWFGLPEDAWPITGIKSTHVIWKERAEVKADPAALFCGQVSTQLAREKTPQLLAFSAPCGALPNPTSNLNNGKREVAEKSGDGVVTDPSFVLCAGGERDALGDLPAEQR